MLHALSYLAQGLGVVALVALIWLVVRAFRTHILWGLFVLLLSPIGALAYACLHWAEARKPFFVYAPAFATSIALGLTVFFSWGGGDVLSASGRVHAGIHDQTLTDQDALRFMHSNLDFIENASETEEDREKAQLMRRMLRDMEGGMTEEQFEEYKRQLSADGKEGTRTPATAEPGDVAQPAPATPAAPPPRYRRAYVEVDPADAGQHIGGAAKVRRGGQAEQEGRLVAVTEDGLRFERRLGSGSLSFDVPAEEIESLKVLSRVAN